MRFCIDKRVVAGVAAVAVAVFVAAPRLLGAFSPALLMVACPLSMLLMMNRMSGRDDPETGPGVDRRSLELEEEVNRLKAELAVRDQHPSA